MEDQPFVIERIYNAPVNKVWPAITDRAQMKEWYFDLSAFRAEEGFEFQFAGEGKKGEKYMHLCRITEVIREKKLSYTWEYENLPGRSEVSFELSPENNDTKVVLTHSGLESFAANGPDFAKECFAEGWIMILGTSLKNFVEK